MGWNNPAMRWKELERRLKGELPSEWEDALPTFTAKDGSVATRSASGKVLNAVGPKIPELIGGSADLAGSTNTIMKDAGHFSADDYRGRNFHYGIREHGMCGIMNGIAYDAQRRLFERRVEVHEPREEVLGRREHFPGRQGGHRLLHRAFLLPHVVVVRR